MASGVPLDAKDVNLPQEKGSDIQEVANGLSFLMGRQCCL